MQSWMAWVVDDGFDVKSLLVLHLGRGQQLRDEIVFDFDTKGIDVSLEFET